MVSFVLFGGKMFNYMVFKSGFTSSIYGIKIRDEETALYDMSCDNVYFFKNTLTKMILFWSKQH